MAVKTVKVAGDLVAETFEYNGPTYETTLSDGRKVIMREMSARDLLFMEKNMSKVGDIERGMRIAERLSIEPGKITFPEIQKLNIRDFRKVSELAAKSGGVENEDEDILEEEDFLE